jgi:spore germination protein
MLEPNAFRITPKQLIFVIIGAQVGTGFFSLPRIASQHANQNAWISVLLGAIMPLLTLFLIERVLRPYPESNLVEVAKKLLGKWLGSLVVVILILHFVFYASVVIRIFAEMVSVFMLPQTPTGVITFMILITGVYVIIKGAKIAGRANEILFYISLFTIALIITTVSAGELTNLLPVGQVSPAALFKGTINTMYSYAGIEVLVVYYFFTNQKDQVFRSGMIAILVTVVTYLIVTLAALLVFGAEYMQNFIWPVLNLLKVIEFDVFHRLEFLLLATWLGIAIRPSLNLGLAANVLIVHILKLDLLQHYPIVTAIVPIIIFVIASIPQNTAEVFVMASYAGYASLIGVLVPAVLYIALLIRGKEVGA